MDEHTYRTLSKLNYDNIVLIEHGMFVTGDTELINARENRSLVEYYFTCTPSLILYILDNYSKIEMLTYLDADLYFYSDPTPIFDEIGDHSIALIEHRYSEHYLPMQIYGKYNVGWLTFRDDKIGLASLKWWRSSCNEWCYKRLENNKYADQKYLDDWNTRYKNVKVIEHKGANLATWNIENYKVSIEGDRILIDMDELIFFHHHSFKKLVAGFYKTGYAKTKSNKTIRNRIFKTYLHSYHENSRYLESNHHLTASEIFRNTTSLFYRIFISGNYVKL